MINFHRKQVWY